jgi:hypothetical protein
MALSDGDIKLFYSGGVGNNDPDASLGGDISNIPLTSTRIFDLVTSAQAAAGNVDYRCVYFNNISGDSSLYDSLVYIESQTELGADITIGVESLDERQDIYVTKATSVSSGSFTLSHYDFFTDSDVNFTVVMDSNISVWASNFQTAIRSVPGLETVTVNASYYGTTAQFNVLFGGAASGKRYYESMNLVSLSQSFLDVGSSLSVIDVFKGAPKLKVAEEISSETTLPANISFLPTSSSSPINVGEFKAGEFFAVWVRRVVVAGVAPMENDGFRIKIKGGTI